MFNPIFHHPKDNLKGLDDLQEDDMNTIESGKTSKITTREEAKK